MPTHDHTNPDLATNTLARHRALLASLERTQPMDWTAWSLPIYDAQVLTPSGMQVALWAVDRLRQSFGDTFLVQAWKFDQSRPPTVPGAEVSRHPLFSQALWPGANAAPWVFANLLQFAAQLALCQHSNRYPRVCKGMRDYRYPVKWVHGLLQFEVASLGMQAGWQASFEPTLATGKAADVRLDGPSEFLLVETMSMRISDREREAIQASSEAADQLLESIIYVQFRRGVWVRGTAEHVTSKTDVEQWLEAINTAAATTAADGTTRYVTGPTEGMLRITKDVVDLQDLTITGGPDVFTDPVSRLAKALREKAEQASSSTAQVWVRLEEYADLWPAMTQNGLSLEQKLAFLAPRVQQFLAPYPELAGVIVAPTALWAGGAAPEVLNVKIPSEDRTAVAVRSGLPYHRARETIIVARDGTQTRGLDIITDWYLNEASWLDWALTQLGHPPFSELIQRA